MSTGPAISEYRIYDYQVSHTKIDPREVDFTTELTIKLVKKTTLDKGEPSEYVYYTDSTYATPICRIDLTFYRDTLGFLTKKEMILSWYLKDGTLSPLTKDISKYYHPLFDAAWRIKENRLKRENLVNDALLQVQNYLVAVKGVDIPTSLAYGKQFVEDNHTKIDSYIDTGDQDTINEVIDLYTRSWMTQDIKDFALNLVDLST